MRLRGNAPVALAIRLTDVVEMVEGVVVLAGEPGGARWHWAGAERVVMRRLQIHRHDMPPFDRCAKNTG